MIRKSLILCLALGAIVGAGAGVLGYRPTMGKDYTVPPTATEYRVSLLEGHIILCRSQPWPYTQTWGDGTLKFAGFEFSQIRYFTHQVHFLVCPRGLPVVLLAAYPCIAFVRGARRRWRRRHLGRRAQLVLIFAGAFLIGPALWIGQIITSDVSESLMDCRWTNSSHGRASSSLPLLADLILCGLFTLLTMPVQYGLLWLGWRVFRGRIRASSGKVMASWVTAALLSPAFIVGGMVIYEVGCMIVTRIGVLPYETDIVLWPLYFLLAPVLLGHWAVRRRARRLKPGCPRCHYNLTGNTSGVCPECGLMIQ